MHHEENQKLAGYKCPKCNCNKPEIGELHITGSFWSKMFDVQGKKFTSITCTACGYTELYKGSRKTLTNISDFLT